MGVSGGAGRFLGFGKEFFCFAGGIGVFQAGEHGREGAVCGKGGVGVAARVRHIHFLDIVCYGGVENRGRGLGRIAGSGLIWKELRLFFAGVIGLAAPPEQGMKNGSSQGGYRRGFNEAAAECGGP